jgi:hypothetical protein
MLLFDIIGMCAHHHLGSLCALSDYLLYLSVDHRLHFLAVGFGVLDVGEGDVAKGSAHTEFCN